MMVATIDPTTGLAAIVSIPRDMERIPLDKGGTSGAMRVNSIYFIRYRDPSLGHTARRPGGAEPRDPRHRAVPRRPRSTTGRSSASATSPGSSTSSAASASTSRRPCSTPRTTTASSRGVWFPAQNDYRLKGDPKCKPRPRKCRSALVYARSRKGTMGTRAEQRLHAAPSASRRSSSRASSAPSTRSAPGIALLGLLHGVREHVETELPMTPEAAAQLFAILAGRAPAAQQHEGAGATDVGLRVPELRDPPERRRRSAAGSTQAFYRVRDRSARLTGTVRSRPRAACAILAG